MAASEWLVGASARSYCSPQALRHQEPRWVLAFSSQRALSRLVRLPSVLDEAEREFLATHSLGATKPNSHPGGLGGGWTTAPFTYLSTVADYQETPPAFTHCSTAYTADGSLPSLRNLALEDSP